MADLVERTHRGEQRAVARLISLIEAGTARHEIAARLPATGGKAHVVGLTGPPGAGKSTSVSALATVLRRQDRKVGVLAVDPSSPFSGGALLGDRVRLGAHAGDSEVFIRSMAGRGQLGGLAAATSQAVRVLDTAGYDVIIVETIGVGQSEVDIAELADTTVLLLAPGMGDEIQAAKAGITEIADVFVVNKADRDEAAKTVRTLRQMLVLAGPVAEHDWTRPVLRTTATRGEGADEVVAALDRHRAWLEDSGRRDRRRLARTAAELEGLVLLRVRERLTAADCTDALTGLAREVVDGGLDAGRAVDVLAEIVSVPTRTAVRERGC